MSKQVLGFFPELRENGGIRIRLLEPKKYRRHSYDTLKSLEKCSEDSFQCCNSLH